MLNKCLVMLSLLMLIPTYANAWYLNAKTSTTGQGTISPAGNKVYTAGVNSDEYTVTPNAEAGYKVARITLDGVTLKANAFGKYVVPYNATKSYRYLVAYFAKNTVDITFTAGAGGAVREDTFESLTKIPVGSARTFLVIPNPGYTIGTVTAAGATITDDATTGYKVVSFTNLQANQRVDATFVATSVKRPFSCRILGNPWSDGIGDQYPVRLTMSCNSDLGYVYPQGLVTIGNSNLGDITYTWSVTGSAANAVAIFTKERPQEITLIAKSAGSYNVTATATSGDTTMDDGVVVTFKGLGSADNQQCTACHSSNTPAVVAAYSNGAHGHATGYNTGTCQRCHATQGALVGFEKGWTGSYATLTANKAAAWTPNEPIASNNGISCAVCHNTHDGLRPVNTYDAGAVVAWDPNKNAASDQYDVCTGCHTLTDNAGALVGNYHDGGSMDVTRTISDTHYDNPSTGAGLTTNVAEGYVIRANSATPCADCHNLHTANIEIQEQWAESAHSGKIAVKKADAACAPALTWWNATYVTDQATTCNDIKTRTINGRPSTYPDITFYGKTAEGIALYKTTGALDDADGNAWVHYNWDKTSKLDANNNPVDDRGSCQHCHTSTGASNFLKAAAAGTVYDATKNDFSHLNGWSALTGSGQQELLYCWGCHSDAQTGALHTTGAITLDYKVNGVVTKLTATDGNSAACISCHSGRGNLNTLLGAAAMDPAGAALGNPATKSHYLAAGLSINQAVVNAGYTFGRPAADYADRAYFAHKNLGCAECHMTSADAHTFNVVEKDAAGVITRLVSTKCIECHDGTYGPALSSFDYGTYTASAAAAVLEEEAHDYRQALDALKAALEGKGLTAINNYVGIQPPSNQGISGAAYNYSYLHHEPGAYAHNSVFARRLIYDSLDWLDNYVIDNSVTLDETLYPAARAWYGAASGTSIVRP